jgi:hypothetical protein
MESKIAWKGELILAAATWADNAGHKAKFKVVGDTRGPNPFKYFTKRRKGKAGTRFMATLAHVKEDAPNGVVIPFTVELMLANWTDSSTSGHSVEFWCPPPDQGMHVFEGYERNKDSFMVALAELDDDDAVIDQKKREVVEQAEKSPHKPGQRLSQAAAMMCQNEQFWEWATVNSHPPLSVMVDSKEKAADWLRQSLAIESRAELDRDPAKAQRFHDEIRKPFVQWQQEGWAAA